MSDSPSTSHPSLFDKDYGDKSHGSSGPDSKTPDSETPDSKTPDSKTVGAASPPASGPPGENFPKRKSLRRESSSDRNTENTDEDTGGDDGEGSPKPGKSPAGGRPPKAPEDRKTARLSICLTEDLLGAVERQADKANLSKSAYARRALAGKDLQTRVDQRHINKLYSAGALVRSVAESLREGEQPSPDQAVRAAEAVEEVIDEIDRQRMD